MIVFTSVEETQTIRTAAEQAGFYYKTTGVWHKTNPIPVNYNLHYISSIELWQYYTFQTRTGTFNNPAHHAVHNYVECALPTPAEREQGKHPTQKPVELMSWFIRMLTNENDMVCDPFMGAGSTGVAALDCKRRYVGIEKDPAYFRIAEQRLQNTVEPLFG